MALNEGTIIDTIAQYERSIEGIRNSYGFSQNPDSLTTAQLPAVLHYSPEFTMEWNRSYLGFKSSIAITSIVLVVPRETKAGQLKFLENTAIPYGRKWRDKFSDSAVINAIASATGGIKVWLTKGNYGAGSGDGTGLLDVGGVSYLGWLMFFSYSDS